MNYQGNDNTMPSFYFIILGRVGFGLNPLEGESEPEELEDTLMGNTTSTFFPANQTATTSFQQQQQNSSSRRVAPVMGNRGLESQRISQDRSRTKTKMGQTTKDSSRNRGSPRSSRKPPHEAGGSTGKFHSTYSK